MNVKVIVTSLVMFRSFTYKGKEYINSGQFWVVEMWLSEISLRGYVCVT